MPQNDRHMVLSLFMAGPGHHLSAWLHPDSVVGADIDFPYVASIAQAAEREIYDMVFLADGLAMQSLDETRYPLQFPPFEPTTLLSALSAVTTRVGLVGSISTTYWQPYNLARLTASLDQLSGGRAGWNVVTSMFDKEARNFGSDHLIEHGDRYKRARVFVDVVKQLWDSWEDNAVIADRANNRAFDPGKIHAIDHRSEFFSVDGPLNLPRPPQGHPLIVQAGASDAGQELSAAVADAVFTVQNNIDSAKAFYSRLKGKMAAYGRRPEDLLVLPGIMPIVGRTKAEAEQKFHELQALIDAESVLAVLSMVMGETDLRGIDLDGPLPDLPESTTSKSRAEIFLSMGREKGLSVRELCKLVAVARGHFLTIGSAEEIADQMETWHREKAADGFNLMPAVMPSQFDDFNALVLPILRERGVVATEYRGRTLRDHMGLPRPAGPQGGQAAGVPSSPVAASPSI